MKTETESIIAKLETRIAEDCRPIDREDRFDAVLDEVYSFESIGGPFQHMSPSCVLKECDPTAYRCGVNDWADGEGWIEIGDENYEQEDVEKVRDEMVSELESQISDLESEIDDRETEIAQEGENEDTAKDIENMRAIFDTLRADLATLEKHSF